MEDLLLQIIKEATGNKFAHLRNAAQNAYGASHILNITYFSKITFVFFLLVDKIQRQQGVHRDPSYELRTVCLTAMQMALDTRRPKFVTMALNGIHV